MSERLLRAEVEDHLERSQRMLVELVNADYEVGAPIAGERARAADLVAAGRLYRRSAEQVGDAEIGGLLEDLERVLVEVANGPADIAPEDMRSPASAHRRSGPAVSGARRGERNERTRVVDGV